MGPPHQGPGPAPTVPQGTCHTTVLTGKGPGAQPQEVARSLLHPSSSWPHAAVVTCGSHTARVSDEAGGQWRACVLERPLKSRARKQRLDCRGLRQPFRTRPSDLSQAHPSDLQTTPEASPLQGGTTGTQASITRPWRDTSHVQTMVSTPREQGQSGSGGRRAASASGQAGPSLPSLR